jgi:hypothetical protein
VVRALAAAEVAVGLWAIAAPSRIPALLVCSAYLAFTVFVAHALRRGGFLTSCGCFGKADTPPTRSHLAVTGAAAVAAAAVVAVPESATWPESVPGAVGTAALAGLIAFLAWQVLAVLPSTTPAAVRSTGKG